eukprot:TRINITY_DN3990_c0_g1_i1.p6 TRINITY_DN3990_c0_g1~~TRINITY_DN3990_c0_g1_i1.p6  ORF type:complete len:283 (+),score=38.84 TRINITY_DN3990_c0_g1_i1:907-1755(+)
MELPSAKVASSLKDTGPVNAKVLEETEELNANLRNVRPFQISRQLEKMQKLLHKGKRDYNLLISDLKKYEEKANMKISSYKNLAHIFNSATMQHEKIEKSTKKFEEKYEKANKEAEYFTGQVKWYDDFQAAYKVLLNEFKRRVTFEEKAENEVKNFGEALAKKFEEEVKERNKFKERALRYFPPPLQPLLFELPIRYEIFPVKQRSAISLLYELDKTVFERITHETARSEMTMEQLLPKKKNYQFDCCYAFSSLKFCNYIAQAIKFIMLVHFSSLISLLFYF